MAGHGVETGHFTFGAAPGGNAETDADPHCNPAADAPHDPGWWGATSPRYSQTMGHG